MYIAGGKTKCCAVLCFNAGQDWSERGNRLGLQGLHTRSNYSNRRTSGVRFASHDVVANDTPSRLYPSRATDADRRKEPMVGLQSFRFPFRAQDLVVKHQAFVAPWARVSKQISERLRLRQK